MTSPRRVCEHSELLQCPGPVLIVVAHPDDEVIALGGHLHLVRAPWIVHTTDGAPRGRSGRQEYAQTRRRELERAVGLAGVSPERLQTLDTVDQESVYVLAEMTAQLSSIVSRIHPYAIVTHPYEGGHPDHDAAACAVSAAVRQIAATERWAPVVIEFASYHNANPHGEAIIRTGQFLPGPDPVETVKLTPEDRERKRQMFGCFESQQEMLALFPVDVENFRYAPAYDFTKPPHEGQLFYEAQGWGVGEEWRKYACRTTD